MYFHVMEKKTVAGAAPTTNRTRNSKLVTVSLWGTQEQQRQRRCTVFTNIITDCGCAEDWWEGWRRIPKPGRFGNGSCSPPMTEKAATARYPAVCKTGQGRILEQWRASLSCSYGCEAVCKKTEKVVSATSWITWRTDRPFWSIHWGNHSYHNSLFIPPILQPKIVFLLKCHWLSLWNCWQ